jgi:hypothetical protein
MNTRKKIGRAQMRELKRRVREAWSRPPTEEEKAEADAFFAALPELRPLSDDPEEHWLVVLERPRPVRRRKPPTSP